MQLLAINTNANTNANANNNRRHDGKRNDRLLCYCRRNQPTGDGMDDDDGVAMGRGYIVTNERTNKSNHQQCALLIAYNT
mmetsp:Transcript_23378/g.51186  ORF Transcript_23378/g.51186 Transcript_23378/m.51186 type:complete len:80 (+) Transcript_23378:312-551(+)